MDIHSVCMGIHCMYGYTLCMYGYTLCMYGYILCMYGYTLCMYAYTPYMSGITLRRGGDLFLIVLQLNEINASYLFQVIQTYVQIYVPLYLCARVTRNHGVKDNETEIKRKQLVAFQANSLSELCWIV
jgi:hypothetical protein